MTHLGTLHSWQCWLGMGQLFGIHWWVGCVTFYKTPQNKGGMTLVYPIQLLPCLWPLHSHTPSQRQVLFISIFQLVIFFSAHCLQAYAPAPATLESQGPPNCLLQTVSDWVFWHSFDCHLLSSGRFSVPVFPVLGPPVFSFTLLWAFPTCSLVLTLLAGSEIFLFVHLLLC